jgi:Bacteriophage HK97-gp10, putative tail-component
MAVAVEAYFDGVPDFLRALAKISAAADAAGAEIVTKGGHAVEAAAKAHTDGRPGPQRQTGNLSRSIRLLGVTRVKPGSWESRTGPTAVYSRRIELGFNQADSLGRVFHQPPYPYMGPGLRDAVPVLNGIYRAAWARALKV